jgi:hypothetical protein
LISLKFERCQGHGTFSNAKNEGGEHGDHRLDGVSVPGKGVACGKDVIFIYRPDGMPRTLKNDQKDGKGFY